MTKAKPPLWQRLNPRYDKGKPKLDLFVFYDGVIVGYLLCHVCGRSLEFDQCSIPTLDYDRLQAEEVCINPMPNFQDWPTPILSICCTRKFHLLFWAVLAEDHEHSDQVLVKRLQLLLGRIWLLVVYDGLESTFYVWCEAICAIKQLDDDSDNGMVIVLVNSYWFSTSLSQIPQTKVLTQTPTNAKTSKPLKTSKPRQNWLARAYPPLLVGKWINLSSTSSLLSVSVLRLGGAILDNNLKFL